MVIVDLVTALNAIFDLQNLLAAIHPGFKIDVMRAMQFTRDLVFDVSICSEGVMSAAHVTL